MANVTFAVGHFCEIGIEISDHVADRKSRTFDSLCNASI